MAYQNINQYNYKKFNLNLIYDGMDMSLASDEKDYKEEVVFSPYIIAQTFGNKVPFYFDLNDSETSMQIPLNYKEFNLNNVIVSQNYYNLEDKDLSCYSASSSCDIGFTGIDNGLVSSMSAQTIYFTNGLFSAPYKFDRYHFDRRLKLFQVTGYTTSESRFEVFPKQTLYEIITKNNPIIGRYAELYGGFYQGFYKLFGYDYDIFPERVNKGWSVEMVLKPRLANEYSPLPNETTLNLLYPKNKNTFFYLGTRAENKFYHYADGTPNCFSGYTRITTPLANCLQTCACCDLNITNSRCIYLYPPKASGGTHDPHLNYGCNVCGALNTDKISCGCGCNELPCETCGWECRSHNCETIIPLVPTPTPTPQPVDTCNTQTPVCTPTCTTCEDCLDCVDCPSTGFTSIEDTCEKDPLFDSMSNNISFKLCGNPKNPGIGIKVLRFTGGCETTGTCTTGQTYVTGYTIQEWCTPPIYPTCAKDNPAYLDFEHWFLLDVVWRRYTFLEKCDLWNFGGLGDITKTEFLESLANNAMALINPPYTNNKKVSETIDIVNLNNSWLDNSKYRKGELLIYVNGKLIYTIDDFEEVIPRGLNTDKEKQVGVPFNISWGGGTQGLHENLVPQTCSGLTGPYIQDPELFPTSALNQSSLSGLNTNILLEQEFGGTFEGAISQFRMYVEPLDSSEIRHNFNVLKEKFNFFNPFCPDCSTASCVPNDFTYTINDLTTTTTTIPTTTTTTTNNLITVDTPYSLGRVYTFDARDKKYLIENKLGKPKVSITSKYWSANGWWGNQGNTPQCVGYAWAHWIEDGPIEHSGVAPIISPNLIYREAQKLDEWIGENYDGTSIRGAAKYLKSTNKISSYLWTYDVNVLINTILSTGPVVVGTNWYSSMFYPNKNGLIKVTGGVVGGHAYVINGVDTMKKLFRLKNSWGKNWGQQGHAFISFSDMSRLIKQNGEVCLAIENKF